MFGKVNHKIQNGIKKQKLKFLSLHVKKGFITLRFIISN